VRGREAERETGSSVVRVMGAKRLRRSRWERGTCERVARGGGRLSADAGGLLRGSRYDPGNRAKAGE
jgi:hypothetical protein